MTSGPLVHHEPDDVAKRGPGTGSLIVIGSILILVGLVAVLARTVDIDLGSYIGEQTWPLLVIVPGVVLLALALMRTPPEGVGFAIAGAIVTAVGAILLAQANTHAWASWAYVWALIPGAAGCGMAGYGLLTRTTDLVDRGVWMILVSGVLYMIGWWYFEALFATGEQPIDIGTWWPLGLILAGAIVAARALHEARNASNRPSAPGAEGGRTP